MTDNIKYYVFGPKINFKIAETVIDGYHIEVDGYTFEQVSKPPRGRSIYRRLMSMDEQTKLVLYN